MSVDTLMDHIVRKRRSNAKDGAKSANIKKKKQNIIT